MKKVISLALAAAMTLSLLTGCGKTDTSAADSTTSAPVTDTSASTTPTETGTDFSTPVTLKVADILPESNLTNTYVLMIEEAITERSNGAITFENYFTGTLGTVKEMAEALVIGSCDLAMITTSTVSSYIPTAAICDMPFLFSDMSSALGAINANAGQIYAGSEATLGHWICTFTQGFNQLSNGEHPITCLEDLAHLKVRVNQSDLAIATWNALGANATPMGGNESYAALQQGVVEGNVVSASSAVTDQYWDIQDYFTYGINSELSTQVWFMSSTCYDKLPEGYADLIMEVYQEYCEELWQARIDEEAELLTTLSEKMEVNELDSAEREKFAAAVTDVWTDYGDTIGTDLINSVAGYTG